MGNFQDRGPRNFNRQSFPIKCSDCGQDATVPFEPKPDRPVYCRDCLPKHRK